MYSFWAIISNPSLQKLLKCSCQGLHWCLWEACLQPFKGFHPRPHDYWFWFLWRLSWTISWLIFHKLEYKVVEKIHFLAQKNFTKSVLLCARKDKIMFTSNKEENLLMEWIVSEMIILDQGSSLPFQDTTIDFYNCTSSHSFALTHCSPESLFCVAQVGSFIKCLCFF